MIHARKDEEIVLNILQVSRLNFFLLAEKQLLIMLVICGAYLQNCTNLNKTHLATSCMKIFRSYRITAAFNNYIL